MTDNIIEPFKSRVVRLAGDVDLEHTPEVRKTLLDAVAERRDVLVDMSEVTYIDSSGIASLIEALQAARSIGAELGLVSVSMQALRVLRLARLDLVFPIHDDLASAMSNAT